LWEGPLQVEQFLRSLVKRARALTEEWLPAVQKNQLLSTVLDISELMNPEAFFSVHRQHSARYKFTATVLFGTHNNNLQRILKIQGNGDFDGFTAISGVMEQAVTFN
jgi:hypothetical protein